MVRSLISGPLGFPSSPNASHSLLSSPAMSITGALGLQAFLLLETFISWVSRKQGFGGGGAAEESARHLQSLLGGPYHSRICLPPGSGPDAHMSHAAAATLLRSCYTGCGQHRCRFCRLGGRAHILPSLGHRRSQGHSSSRNCRLHENTEWRHEAQPWLAEPGALRRAKF